MRPTITGSLDGTGLAVAVVQARFNPEVTEPLRDSAVAGLLEKGVEERDIHVYSVPGAVELPLAAQRIADSGRVDAVVVVGAVIKGETDHYEYVCQMVADGCMKAGLALEVPIAFGVLTTQTEELAMARLDKGRDCAHCAIEMVNLLRGRFA